MHWSCCAAHGIKQIAATLGYLPDAIHRLLSATDRALGVSPSLIMWKQTPLGTAGGVKRAQRVSGRNVHRALRRRDYRSEHRPRRSMFHRQRKLLLQRLCCAARSNPLGIRRGNAPMRTAKSAAFYEKPAPLRRSVRHSQHRHLYFRASRRFRLHSGRLRSTTSGHDLFPALVRGGRTGVTATSRTITGAISAMCAPIFRRIARRWRGKSA